MMEMVRNYMMNILQPYSECMEELRGSTTRISDDVIAALEQLEQHSGSLRSQERLLFGIQANGKTLEDRIIKLESDLSTTNAQRLALGTDHTDTKGKLARLESRLTGTQEELLHLQQGQKDDGGALTKLQDAQAEMKRCVAEEVRPQLDGLASDLASLEGAHQRSVMSADETKIVVKTAAADIKLLTLKHEAECSANEGNISDLEGRIRKTDDQLVDAQKLLKARLDHNQAHNKAIESLQRRLEVQISSVNLQKERQDKSDAQLVATDTRASALERTAEQLVGFMKKLSGKRDVSDAVDELGLETGKMVEDIRQSRRDIVDLSNHLRHSDDKIDSLEKDKDGLVRRALRIEKSVGISKPPKSVPDTDATYKQVFEKFDEDGNGSITITELGAGMEMLGARPSDEVIRQMIAWVDIDGSGTIEFAEFCTLMGDMMGPDGQVDPTKLTAEYAVESLSIMAKGKNNVFTIMEHTNQISDNKRDIEHLKAIDVDGNLKRLREEQAAMLKQMDALKQGIDLSKEYWKGMAKGLKETKSQARAEGDRLSKTTTAIHQRVGTATSTTVGTSGTPLTGTLGGTLSSTLLPAISGRPGSRGNMTARW